MNKIDRLRTRIEKENLNGYIIPTFDEFLSEYPAKSFKRLEYITDFSCSNGVFIIGIKVALFFTDSRYIDAAVEHFKNSDVKVFNFSELKNFDYTKYFSGKDKIGFDPRFFTKNFKNYFTRLNLVSCKDLIDDIWENRPDLNLQPIFEYEDKFSGESRESKFLRVREFIKESGAESLILTSCESVCWLLNMRSFDAEFSPIILSYLYIDFHRVVVFTHSRDLPKPMDGIEFKNLNEFEEFANQISGKLIIPNDTSIYISEITKRAEIICKDDPCLIMRSQKNETEIEGAKNAHLQDAIALIEFLAWFYEEGYGKSEFELGLILTEFRSMQKSYLMDSFPPIVGFCENGAKIHYRATNDSKTVEGDGLLLIAILVFI